MFTNVVVVVLVLGVMIFVHELGHFLAAKAFGVRVLTFSLGFGKRLFGVKRDETDYRVSLLPLGGYVKMAGEDPAEAHVGEAGEFLSKPRWQRFIVVLMGPVMNALLAVGLLAGTYAVHYQKPAYEEGPARVGDVDQDSPAARAGLQPGDTILRLDDLRHPRWQDVELKVAITVGRPLQVEVLRTAGPAPPSPATPQEEGSAAASPATAFTLLVALTPRVAGPHDTGYVGWYPYLPGIIERVQPGMPAERAGVRPGDQIVGLNGHKMYFWPSLRRQLQALGGKSVELTLLRREQEVRVTLAPVYNEREKWWQIGVGFRSPMIVARLPLAEAVKRSLRDNLRNTLTTFDVLGKIITRRLSARSLSGPIGIAQISGEAYRAGIPELLMLTAFISLQLGIFNLLPIPILDGGVILLLAIESFMRRDISLKMKERFVRVGFVFLLLLAAFVMYNDIVKVVRPG